MLNGMSSELIVIFVVAFLVFGPKRLPELGKALGRAIHEFKRASNEFRDNLEAEIGAEKIKEEISKQKAEITASVKTEEKPSEPEKPAPPQSHAG